jgi:RNA polymerase sigma-70 factor (ECF subfamily)
MLGFTEDYDQNTGTSTGAAAAAIREVVLETAGGEATAAGEAAAKEEQPTAAANAAASAANEKELVDLARAGDTAAFGQLIQRHYSTCLKRAMLMIRNRSDAEDEVQNACWKAFQRLEQFRGEGTFAAWLSRIVENQCLMRIREERNSRFVYLDEPSESNVRIELVGQMTDPEDQLGWEEVAALLRTEISRIPPLLRNVMMLRDIEQMSMPDVAARLGLSVPAAKSRLMRARMELRSRVGKHCGRKGAGTLMQRARYNQAAYARAS